MSNTKESECNVWRARDGFVGHGIGTYCTREGVNGIVLQQIGTRIVHVYRMTSVEHLEPNDAIVVMR